MKMTQISSINHEGFLKDAVVPAWGYDFPEVVEMMNNTLNSVLAKDVKFTLCIHDWGIYK
jgi:hypothetical protein